MANVKPTRASLLIKIRDNSDQEAWNGFVAIYGPLVFSFGRRCGLQDSDASDLVQEVMGEVAKSIGKFEYDPKTGKFRSWLYKIAKRTMSRIYRKKSRQQQGTGGSDAAIMIENVADSRNDLEETWTKEYEQTLLNWAADKIRHQFREETWKAFWMTAIEQKTPQVVAEELGMSVGSIYIAKSRVLKRLSEKIQEVDGRELDS